MSNYNYSFTKAFSSRLIASLLSLAMLIGLFPGAMLTASAGTNSSAISNVPWIVIDESGDATNFVRFHVDSSKRTKPFWIFLDSSNTVPNNTPFGNTWATSSHIGDWDSSVNGTIGLWGGYGDRRGRQYQSVWDREYWGDDVKPGPYGYGFDGYLKQPLPEDDGFVQGDLFAAEIDHQGNDVYWSLWVENGTKVKIGSTNDYSAAWELITGTDIPSNDAGGHDGYWSAEYILRATGWKDDEGARHGIKFYDYGADTERYGLSEMVDRLNAMLSHWPHGNGFHSVAAENNVCVVGTPVLTSRVGNKYVFEYTIDTGELFGSGCTLFGQNHSTATGRMTVMALTPPDVSCDSLGYVTVEGGNAADWYEIINKTDGNRKSSIKTGESTYMGFGKELEIISHWNDGSRATIQNPSYKTGFQKDTIGDQTTVTLPRNYNIYYQVANPDDGIGWNDIANWNDADLWQNGNMGNPAVVPVPTPAGKDVADMTPEELHSYKQEIAYDDELTLPALNPQNGQSFLGWATSPTLTAMYGPNVSYSNLFNGVDRLTNRLYARWEQKKVRVILYKDNEYYNENGDNVPDDQKNVLTSSTVLTGANITGYPSVRKDGYHIKGWYNDPAKESGDTNVYDENGDVAKDDNGQDITTPIVQHGSAYNLPTEYTFNKPTNKVWPHWEANKVTVTYDKGATDAKDSLEDQTKPAPQDVVYSNTNLKGKYTADGPNYEPAYAWQNTEDGKADSAERFTRQGYKFAGWSRSSGTSVAEFTPTELNTDAASYDSYDEEQKKEVDAADLNILTRNELDNDRNITLYAVWQKYGNVELKYNAGDRTGDPTLSNMPTSSAVEGDMPIAAASLPQPKCDGYTFVGWTYKKTNETTGVTTDEPIDGASFKEGPVELTAQWKPNKYFVKYDIGMTNAEQTAEKDENGNATYCIGTDLTDKNSELDPAVNGELKLSPTVNALTAVNTTDPVGIYRAGYTLKGWSTILGGKGKVFDVTEPFPAGSLTPDTNLDATPDNTTEVTTLYAVWEPNVYKVHFDPGKGEGENDQPQVDQESKDVTYKTAIGSIPAASRPGYVLDGWYEVLGYDGDGNAILAANQTEPKDNLDKPHDITLMAKWRNKGSITVTLVPNDNVNPVRTLGMDLRDVYYQKGVWDLVREGYTFDGWYHSKKDGTGKDVIPAEPDYSESAKVTKDKTLKSSQVYDSDPHTLFGKWTPNKYKIRYNSNYGDTTLTDETKDHSDLVEYDKDVTLETPFTYSGHTLRGWATDQLNAEQGLAMYANGATVKNLIGDNYSADPEQGVIDLYAVWGEDTRTVTFYSNGAIYISFILQFMKMYCIFFTSAL